MLYFNADPRDAYASGQSACNTCCCEKFNLSPGEVNKLMINYSTWAAPLGGIGLQPRTQFSIEKKSGEEPDDAPNSINLQVATTVGVAIDGDIAATSSSPTGKTLVFGLVPLSGPDHGQVTVNEDGTFEYTPDGLYVGYDRFFFTVSDGDYTVIREAAVKVSKTAPATPLPDPNFTPDIRVDPKTVNVTTGFMMSAQIAASPSVSVGSVYRMVIKQPALDCDCNEYFHLSCYDIIIGKC